MAREIEIEFERGGKFVATLFDEEAPETCNFVWNLLPLERIDACRAMISGAVIDVPIEGKDFKTLEHVYSCLDPGLIGFVTSFFPKRPKSKPRVDILIGYGRNLIHTMSGFVTPTNIFAKITEGTVEQLSKVADRIKEQGIEKVTITRKP